MTENPIYDPAGTPLADARAHHGTGRTVRVLAGTGRRVAARVFSWLGYGLVGAGGFALALRAGAAGPAVVAVVVVLFLALVLWHQVFPIGRWGCGFGEWVVGIRIVRFEDGVSPPGFRRALTRAASPRRRGLELPDAGWLRDEDLRRGRKDRRAGTVVVRHQAPPGAAWPDDWERGEARRRGAVGFVVVAAAVALVTAFAVTAYRVNAGPPFTVAEYYGSSRVWSSTMNGETVTLDRTGARLLGTPNGCASGAATSDAGDTLRSLHCQARLRADFSTRDGSAHLTGQIFRFDRPADADGAAHRLRAADLTPAVSRGELHGELVDSQDRYLVVTSVTLAAGDDAATARARAALAHLHASTLGVVLWQTA